MSIPLAIKIRELRKRENLSLDTLARMSGLHIATVVEMEKAGANPTLKTLRRASHALGISVSELLEDTLDA